MKIVNFNEIYLRGMAELFVKEYSEKNRVWNVETATKYLKRNIESDPDYCKVAVTEEGEFIGGICCRTDPYYSGTSLFIDSLEVKNRYRKVGVGKTLFKCVVEIAKQYQIKGIHFLGDGRKRFPQKWYHKLGFVESGWIEYEAQLETLKL